MMTQFETLATWLKMNIKSDRGAAMVEYALLLALIAIVCIAALSVLGDTVSQNFSDIDSDLQSR